MSFLLHTWILTVEEVALRHLLDKEQLTYTLDRRLFPLVFLFSCLAVATFIPGSITKACQVGKSLTTTSNILVLTGGHQFLPTFDVCSDATSAS